tara:strand:- start:460 stop:657 length:198 start_codon:yes stop_codon:yes gene_type:complete
MIKVNITNYSDNELSLLVMNDEDYYIQMENPKLLLETLYQDFIYTDKQLKVLIDTMREDYEDYNE